MFPIACRWLAFLAFGPILWVGCGPSGKITPAAPTAPSSPLTVLVVDDSALGKAIESEWGSRTEGEVSIRSIAWKDVAAAQRLPGDVIVFPAGQIGALAEAGLIAPISDKALAGEALDLRDIYKQIRLHEMKWGDKVYALPLGSPQWTLAYRSDILTKLNAKPPATWEEYDALAARLAKREELGDLAPAADEPWHGTAQPLAEGYAGQLLLARAAAYAAHREQVSPLFELTTLKPLVDQAPYVRALAELAAVNGQAGPPFFTPAQVYREILEGRCAMAITWPAAGAEVSPATANPKRPIAFAELPGSPDVYDFSDKKWAKRGPAEDPHVPLLAVSGRMAAVIATSSQHDAAENLAVWLGGLEAAAQISPASQETTLFRISQEPSATRWLGAVDETSQKLYVQSLRQAQERPQRSQGIRLPGREEYLAALDGAVWSALQEKKSPEDALTATAKEWEEITHRRGLVAQRTALERSLGLRRTN